MRRVSSDQVDARSDEGSAPGPRPTGTSSRPSSRTAPRPEAGSRLEAEHVRRRRQPDRSRSCRSRPSSGPTRPTSPAAPTSTGGGGRSTCGRSCAGSTTRSTATGSGSSGREWRRSRPRAVLSSSPTTPAPSPRTRRPSCTASRPRLGRPVYGLADYFFRTIPVVGTLWSRTGGVPAHPDNAYRLLHDQQQLALVFPEGTKATSKTYADRYRLRRFGRGGFVEIAMRAGVPIVPIAVVGAEESMPIVFRVGGLAKLLKLPYFPVTVNSLLLGPLGYVTYFPAKIKMRVLDPITFDVEPGLERYSRSKVMDEAENVRADAPGRAPRHAPRAPQHLVRLIPMGRRVLITGLDTFWGGRMAQALEAEPDIEMILGLGTDDPKVPLERTEFVRSDQKYSILNRIVRATQVDTVVHTFLETNSTRCRARALHEINVIGTLNLLAAAGSAGSSVRKVVVKSSTHVYGAANRTPPGSARRHQRTAPGPDPARALAARGRVAGAGLHRGQPPPGGHRAALRQRARHRHRHPDQPQPAPARCCPCIAGFDPLRAVRRGGRRRPGPRVRHRPTTCPGSSTWPARARLPWSEVASIGGAHLLPLPPLRPELFASPLRRLGGLQFPPEMEALAPLRAGRGHLEAAARPGSSTATPAPGRSTASPGPTTCAGPPEAADRSTATSRTSSSSSATRPPWSGAIDA